MDSNSSSRDWTHCWNLIVHSLPFEPWAWTDIGNYFRKRVTDIEIFEERTKGWALAGGPPSTTLAYIILSEGAPSLRFLQGWVAMLPTQLSFFRKVGCAYVGGWRTL
jgi:hypothetical protein